MPVNKNVHRAVVKSNDVIHDWAVPAFGVKLDAVPGRVRPTWFRAEREGVFYGQCSEALRTQSRLHADRGSCRIRKPNSTDWLAKTKA